MIKNFIIQDNLEELKSFTIYNDLKNSQISSDAFDILNCAIENNTKLDIIKFILTQYKNLNYEVNDAEIPLYIAIEHLRFDIANLLLKHGANINLSTWNGDNILIHFLKNKKLNHNNLKYILEHGVDINFEDERNKRFLDYIIENQNIPFLKIVFKHFVYSNSFILNMVLMSKKQEAINKEDFKSVISQEKKQVIITKSMYIQTIKLNNLELLNQLIENDWDDHIIDIINRYQLLLVAAEISHWDIVIYLIEKLKIKVNERNGLRKTPLMFASEQGNRNIVEYLVSNGALVNDKDTNGLTPLIYACKNGRIEVVGFLIDSGAILDDQDRHGLTALMYAAKFGHCDVITYLLEHGANIHTLSDNGSSALIYSAMNNQKETTTLLLKSGLNINEKNSGGWTVLMHASKAGNIDIVRYLVENGAYINEQNTFSKTALMYASQNGHEEIVRFLLEHHAMDYRNHDGSVSMMVAAQNGHRKVVECLLQDRIRKGERRLEKEREKYSNRDKDNIEPLEENKVESGHDGKSVKSKYRKIINICQKIGLSPPCKGKRNPKNDFQKQGKSKSLSSISSSAPLTSHLEQYENTFHATIEKEMIMILMTATQNKRLNVVDYIIDKSCINREQRERLMKMAFLRATEVNGKEIIDYFVGKGINIDMQDELGHTPLMVACSFGYKELVHYLIDHGANLNICNSDSNTALHLSLYGGFTEISETLIEHGAMLNVKGYAGNTPLILASKDNNETMVRCLVEHGAEVNGRNNHGKTALFYAAKYGRMKLVTYLIDHGANLHIRTRYGSQAVFAAFVKGHPMTVRYLVLKALQDTKTWHARCRWEILKFLLFC